MKSWPIIEWNQNLGRIYDVVTKTHAEDLEIGQDVMVVVSDHKDDRYLDFGYCFLATITDIRPDQDTDVVIVYAEVKE